MIIEGLLNVITSILELFFSLLPDIPEMPSVITSTMNVVRNTITSNLGLLDLVIRPTTLTRVIPLLIVILNLERIWKVLMWLIRKIPMLGMS